MGDNRFDCGTTPWPQRQDWYQPRSQMNGKAVGLGLEIPCILAIAVGFSNFFRDGNFNIYRPKIYVASNLVVRSDPCKTLV